MIMSGESISAMMPLSSSDLLAITFAGVLEGLPALGDRVPSAYCLDLEKQLAQIFLEERGKNPLINERFHIITQGAFYSPEIYDALSPFYHSNGITWFFNRPGRIILPQVKYNAGQCLKHNKIPQADYESFFRLGKKIEVERVLYL